MVTPCYIFVIIYIFVINSSAISLETTTSDVPRVLKKNCAEEYSSTCLKLDLVSFVDKISEQGDVKLLPGVTIVHENATNSEHIVQDLAREFPNDPDARLDAYLFRKVKNYLSSHSIRVNLWKNDGEFEGRGRGGGGGGGGTKGGGGGGGYILAAAAIMKGTLLALALGGLATLAGKALMTGMISLMLSTLIGLKALTSKGGSQTTYEVIAKPVYTSSHSATHEEYGHHGHSGYGRSLSVPIALQERFKLNKNETEN